MKNGTEIIKLSLCSTQLNMKFVLLIILILQATANSFLLNIDLAEHENFFNYCWHFHIYLQRKFHAQLSLA